MTLAESARETELRNSTDEDQFRQGCTYKGPYAVCENAQQPECKKPKASVSVPGWVLIWTFLSTPVIVFLLTHTALGFGHKLYSKLAQHYDIAYYLVLFVAFVLVVAYVFDGFMDIQGARGRVKMTLLALCVCILSVACILAVDKYPSAPAVLCMLTVAAAITCLRVKFYNQLKMEDFFLPCAYVFGFNGVVILVYWLAWVFVQEWEWDDETKNSLMDYLDDTNWDDAGCTDSEGTKSNNKCLAAYLLWCWPCLIAGMLLMFGSITYYLVNSYEIDTKLMQIKKIMNESLTKVTKTQLGIGKTTASWEVEKDEVDNSACHSSMPPAVRLLGSLLAVGLISIWVAASIAGAEMALADVVLHFALITFALLAMMIVSALGWGNMKKQFEHIEAFKKLKGGFQSNLGKAVLLVTCCPLICGFVLLSRLNMYIRNALSTNVVAPAGETSEKAVMFLGGPLTPKMSSFIREMFAEPTAVLSKALWVGVLYFTLDVGVLKVVTLILSWLNDALSAYSTGVTMAIFVVVGISLFLLPPVPGVPVYLTGGVILVNAYEDSLGFWGAILLCIIVCFLIKLSACTIQQKGFGEGLGSYVSIRKTVGINSVTIRAINVCLSKPGLSFYKVAILCGGPDWPTSVLCGILKLRLPEMLLGTTPVLPIYLGWTVLAGAFMLKNDDPEWSALASLMLMVSAVTMGMTSLAAIYAIERTISTCQDEIDAIPIDEEVLIEDQKDEALNAATLHVNQWANVPSWGRKNLIMGVMCMSASCWLFGLWGDNCFITFNVTDDIQDRLDGNWFYLVKEMGWIAVGLFAVACVNLHIFRHWSNKTAKKYLEEFPNGPPASSPIVA